MHWKNKKTKLDGYTFASKLEAAVYALLRQDKTLTIQTQDHVYLTDARILYIPDFKCTPVEGDPFWVEAKGFETDVWRIKRRLWKHYGFGKLLIYKGSAARPYLDETLTVTEKTLLGLR